MATDHFCLKWNNFHSSILSALESLQSSEDLVDVTLMCEGRNVKAHKVILSACSPYFRNLFKETPCQHPIIILKDVLHCDLIAILHFMYQGEVLIQQDGLASFLKTAELLQVSGLAGNTPGIEENLLIPPNSAPPTPPLVPVPIASPSSPSPRPTVHKCKTDTQSKQPSSTKQGASTKQTHTKQAEKENSPKKDDKQPSQVELDSEPMQSCSYQPECVVIKKETEDHFENMDYDMIGHESLDPKPTTEEQSILERSLKAQGMSPHSSKLYTMDLSIGPQISTIPSPNQSTLSPHSELMKHPCDAPLVLVTKNNTELSKDSGKRKIKPALEPIPSNKKIFIKSIVPKIELKTKETNSPPGGEVSYGAQFGKCPHCTKVYSNQSALKYHVRLVHSDMLNMFCCHLCPESFEYRESYKAHMWEKHSVRN